MPKFQTVAKRLREQNRIDKAERKIAQRQERKAQRSNLPAEPAGERIEPPALLP
jgi:hypothetical protein